MQKSKCKISQFEDLSMKFKQFIKNNMTEEIKENQRKRKQKSRLKQTEQNPQMVKDDQNRWREKSDAIKRDNDNEAFKECQNKRAKLSRKKRKLVDPLAFSNYEKEVKKKRRKLWNGKDRLREFKEATKYNAIFICSCCHRRLFQHNVQVITQKLKDDINGRKLNHYENCIDLILKLL